MTRSLTALLDPKASAKAVNDQRSLAVRIKMTDPSVTRDMDILDDVEAVWLTDDMAITVPVEKVNAFRTWVASRGTAPVGRGSYTVDTFGDQDVTWDGVIAAVTA